MKHNCMTACCRRFANVLRLVDLGNSPWRRMELFSLKVAYVYPQKSEVKMNILREAHHTPYMVHPGETKMYQDTR
jgi:hypothetical protein